MSNVNNVLANEMSVVSSLILDESKNGKKIRLVTVDERKDSSAFTDGSSIIQVPVNFGNVTPQLRSVAYGFLSHEASHCRNTDFTVIRKLVETYGGLAHRLQNTIEDPRIERIAILQFPGQRQHLNTTKEHVIAQGWWSGPNPKGICWQETLLSYALYWGNMAVGFKCAEPLLKSWEKIFNDMFTHYCGKDAPDFIREQIKNAVLSDQADATALAVEKILDLILANKDKFRQDLKNMPESRTTSNSYDLKGLYDEEQEQQNQTGNGTGSTGNNAEGESTGEGNGAESEDADGSNTGSAGSESSEGEAGSEVEGDNADSNGTEAEDGESGAEEAEDSNADSESDSAGSETEADSSDTDSNGEGSDADENAEEETEGSNTNGESEAEGNSEEADGDNAGSVGSETDGSDAEGDSAADEADGNGSNTEAGADEADGEGSESEGDTDSEDAGSEGNGCTHTFGGVPLDQSKAQQEAEDAMQKAFEELQAVALAASACNSSNAFCMASSASCWALL